MKTKRNFVKTLAMTAIASLAIGTAFAAEITGAGATFPFPIYAKWAEAYKAATGNSLNYQSIGSSGGIRQIKAKTVTFVQLTRQLLEQILTKTAWFSSLPSSAELFLF